VHDNILGDIENLTGGSGSDTLTGNGGNNRLEGRGGFDTLIGLDGNDVLVAKDDRADTSLDCDGGGTPGGADTAQVDPSDPAPAGCETIT
jgi:Ca2+-binding RTX toxin-like protein